MTPWSSHHCWVVEKSNIRLHFTWSVASKFPRSEFCGLQWMGNAPKKSVHNTHCWPWRLKQLLLVEWTNLQVHLHKWCCPSIPEPLFLNSSVSIWPLFVLQICSLPRMCMKSGIFNRSICQKKKRTWGLLKHFQWPAFADLCLATLRQCQELKKFTAKNWDRTKMIFYKFW